MAFLSNIWGAKPAATPAPAPAPALAPAPIAAGPAMKQTGGPANPGADPANMQQPLPGAAPAPGPIPELDAFSNLFKPKPVDPNAPKRPTLADPILTPLDPAAFQQQVQQANFAASIPPETLAKAAAGDATALAAAINAASQAAFAAGTQLSHGLVEHGSRTAAERVDGTLDVRLRNQQIRMQNVDNPVLQHPAVAPVVGAIKAQIANQNPQMSPAEVIAATEQYFNNMQAALGQPAKAAQEAATAAAKKGSSFGYLLED